MKISKGTVVHLHTAYETCTVGIILGDGHDVSEVASTYHRERQKSILQINEDGTMKMVEAVCNLEPSYSPEEGEPLTWHTKEVCPFDE